jgi:ribosomal protein S18 acetylase RimI-like enzyme
VVRRVLPAERGPSGGPAMTDLLGVMESWSDTATVVRDEQGRATTIALRDIVSGKPVQPRPPVRLRVSPEDAERRANASWPALEAEPLGDWLMRASGGFSSRANSVMAVGDAGVPFDHALRVVSAFYDARDLPPWAQLVVGSDLHASFVAAGWVRARPGEADTEFQLGSVAAASRGVRRLVPRTEAAVSVSPVADAAWLANDARALGFGDAARTVMEGPEDVGFVSVGPSPVRDEPVVLAKGRVAVAGDWAGVTDVWVSPAHRRQGFALVVMGALLDLAAERGATTVFLQTRGDNPAALALYDRLGFVTHHTYRYLTPGPV